MKKLLLLTLLVITTTVSYSQPSVGFEYTSNGFGMSISALSNLGGVEGTVGYSVPLTSALKPLIGYLSIGKQLLLTNYDEDNLSLTPSLGAAMLSKSVVNSASPIQGDLKKITYRRVFVGLELGKDSYMGRISIIANYSDVIYYGIRIRAFIR